MSTRAYFDQQLAELHLQILEMGRLVGEELNLALAAFRSLDREQAQAVRRADKEINQLRFDVEEHCFSLIATQQPTARDLRAVVSAMNIVVDLERMGDQAKGIAKVIPHLLKYPDVERPDELAEMGVAVHSMLSQAMTAYADGSVALAKVVAEQDDAVDALYGRVFSQIMRRMADTAETDHVEAAYELLRVARELERFGDLATNIAERTIFLITGSFSELNTDDDEDK